MSPEYHPELDKAPLVNADDHSKYRPGHIRTQHNLADINTKQLNGLQTHSKNQQLIFRSVDSRECKGLNPITKETGESKSDQQTVKTTVRSLT